VGRDPSFLGKAQAGRQRGSDEQLKEEQTMPAALKPGEDLVALPHAFDALDDVKLGEKESFRPRKSKRRTGDSPPFLVGRDSGNQTEGSFNLTPTAMLSVFRPLMALRVLEVV
jgi:hypothetical protein